MAATPMAGARNGSRPWAAPTSMCTFPEDQSKFQVRTMRRVKPLRFKAAGKGG